MLMVVILIEKSNIIWYFFSNLIDRKSITGYAGVLSYLDIGLVV
tara:strand:+ start:732 stop:863 length:132 start_codon:yes stop_codon:yes gene_type:complete